jgi:hypothetical protein
VLLASGAVKCWGNNSSGQLGNGSTANSLTAVDVSGLSSGVVDIQGTQRTTCAVLSAGDMKCWGAGNNKQLGNNAYANSSVPVSVQGLGGPAVTVQVDDTAAFARMADGSLKYWGVSAYGKLGNGTTTGNNPCGTCSPLTTNGPTTDGAPIASQGSVLITKTAASGQVSGHITPIPWSLSKTSTGRQALIVTFDPLAAAAAMFIEQYDAHIAACNATSSESMTETNQKDAAKLWACSNPSSKASYLSGMLTLLKGARHYLYGSDNGCIQSTQTVAGQACPSTVTGPDPVHYPYTFVVPDYTSAAYDSSYYAQLDTALATYRGAIIASNGTRLERTMQLVGIQKFTTESNAIVSTRVVRSGQTSANPLDCVVNDGFASRLQ